ncbi:ABC transporter permease [Actinomadura rupiterrae]|uniref:ABC transporter permease n=1 Tax=Actinomadura rupiterrae TaxID=559627 RepID=UPI0020A55259|nr:ABC transporter permease [Actinomadura rupiterrae]MCP2339283.1 ABC-2 type transport system permease protein [Actinomadura rupiterrae]
MNSTAVALRAGLARGMIEFRQSVTGPELLGHLLWPVATLVAVFFLRHRQFQHTGFKLGTLIMPSVLGMFTCFGAVLLIQQLTAEREDGTLLRAKAVPNGIRGYFLGKLVTTSATIVGYLVILMVPGLFMVTGLEAGRAGSWATFAWVLLLGLVATQSIGAMLGSLIASPRGAGYLSILVMGLISISGIFYPITALPGWLQATAQVFPIYWLGLGMRSALLPHSMAAVELGHSWRHLETLGVLGAWALVGVIVAPIVLSRMARKESGSRVAERRAKLLQRVG